MDSNLPALAGGVGLLALLFLSGKIKCCMQAAFKEGQALQSKIAAQEQLAAIVEASDDGIIGKDREGVIISWNGGAEHLLGYRAEEAVGQPGAMLFAADKQEVETHMMAMLGQGQRIRNFETVMRRKDGQPVAVSLTCSPIRDSAGQIVGISQIVRDISEQKQAEAKIRQLNLELQSRVAELETVLDTVPVAIAIAHDRECRVIRMNRAGESLLGIPPGSNASKSGDQRDRLPFKVFRGGRELAVDELPMQCAARNAKPVREIEAEILRDDGRRITLYEYASPLFDEEGLVRGAVGVFVNITERKRTEEALRQERLLLRQVIDSSPNIIFVKDEAGRYLLGNQALAGFFGHPLEAVIGKTDAELNPLPGQTAKLRADDLQVFGTRQTLHIPEEAVPAADGETHWFNTVKTPLLDTDGTCDKLLGVAMDITQRKQAEEALRAADRRKDQFLAMLAHELRNPLAPIRNALQVMKSLGPREPRLEWSRAVIDRQIAHMARLLDDLLDVARIRQGKVALKAERVSLEEAIDRALEASLPLIEAKGHDISVKLPQEPCWLRGDLVRLAQVLSNLLNNAAKYTGEGGHIRLSAEREEDWVVIRVADDGTGIAPELLPNIFKLFAQADHSLAHAQGGLGLGLPLARQLAELHGGTLTGASPGLGQGSEFTLRLPLLQEKPREHLAEPAEPAPQAAAKLKILIVDDYIDAAETLAVWLRLTGYEVRSAENGAKALECAASFEPQVVLLDIGMPDMDGYEVARQMRLAPATRDAVLVALTGYGQEKDLQRSRAAGFDHHLLKPVGPEQLTELLASLAAGKAAT